MREGAPGPFSYVENEAAVLGAPKARPTRQIEIYDAGPTLRYGPDHTEDDCGQLSQATLDGPEDWTPWGISREEFEAAWRQSE